MDCGDVNLLSGENSAGKSSVLDILCAAFQSKGDRSLLKAGATEGSILVVLEDEDQIWEIRRTLSPGEVSQPRVKGSKTGTKGAPSAWLKEIADLVSMDVLRHAMTASPKEQAEILLATMPLDLELGAIDGALTGVDALPMALRKKIGSLGALDAIATVYDYLYEERKGVNRLAEDKDRTVRELSGTVGAAGATADHQGALTDLRKQRQTILDSISQTEAKSQKLLTGARDGIRADYDSLRQELKEKAQAKIDSINSELRENLDALRTREQTQIEAADKSSAEALKATTEVLRVKFPDLDHEIGSTEQKVTQAAGAAATRAIIARTTQERDEKKLQAKVLTAALEKLKDLKAGLLEKLPIKGLEFKEGLAYLNGVPLQEVNTEARARFWIRVAAIRAAERDLAVIVIDDFEKFSPKNAETVIAQMKASGLQWFLGKVSGEPFKIETV
jgi:hypothetical protein